MQHTYGLVGVCIEESNIKLAKVMSSINKILTYTSTCEFRLRFSSVQ